MTLIGKVFIKKELFPLRSRTPFRYRLIPKPLRKRGIIIEERPCQYYKCRKIGCHKQFITVIYPDFTIVKNNCSETKCIVREE